MIRLTDSRIDSCCSKLTKNDLKGLVKVPCAYRGHTKYGSRSGQVTKGHGFQFLLHGRATHVLWLIFHAESDGNGYMWPQVTVLVISVHWKHKKSFIPYITKRGLRKKVNFQLFIFDIKMHFSRRALSQESSGAICFHMRCSEVPLIRENADDVTMPYTCWSYFLQFGGQKSR